MVAAPIAQRLGAALEVWVVRKVGAPGDPEYGLGAVAEGDVVQIDDERTRRAGVSRAELVELIERERREVVARARRLREGGSGPVLGGRCVVLVDDGAATGGTIETGVASVRAQGPAAIWLALGVAPSSTVERLRTSVDGVEVALAPSDLAAVGQWYRRYAPVEDAEVLDLLRRGRRSRPIGPT